MTSQDEKIAKTVDRIRLLFGRMRRMPEKYPPELCGVDAIYDLVHKYESLSEITRETGINPHKLRNALCKFAAMHDGTQKGKGT